MPQLDQKEQIEYRKLLDEIGKDYCPSGCYCIFKEILLSIHPSRRLLFQIKSIDRVKLLWSKDQGRDVGWEYSLQRWIDDGNAKKFSDAYSDTKSEKEIFEEIIATKLSK